MSENLQLSCAASITTNQHGVILESDLGQFQLHGEDVSEFISNIYPLLDGNHNQREICQALPQYDDDSIIQLLEMLINNALVEKISKDQQATEPSPPWPMHERFFTTWQQQAGQVQLQSQQQLKDKKLLVIGLEPWAVTMVSELANFGVGAIHILDQTTINQDDLLCYRQFTTNHIGSAKALILQQLLAEQSPWCTITHQAQQLPDDTKLPWDLVIVTLSDDQQHWRYNSADFINQHQLTALYGHLNGLESTIGPVVTPKQKGCWNCVRLRKLGCADNVELAHQLDNSDNPRTIPRSRTLLAPMAAITGQQLAMEALKLLLNYTESQLKGEIQIQDLINSQTQNHTVLPVPFCPVCDKYAQPLNTQLSQPINESIDDPLTDPKLNPLNAISTVAQLKQLMAPWISPVTGVIKQISGHPPQLAPLPLTATAELSHFTLGRYDDRHQHQMGLGKGTDELSAHISAIGEAIERYSAARYRLEDCHIATIAEFQSTQQQYVNPKDLVLYQHHQYQQQGFPFCRWHNKIDIPWVKGQRLSDDQSVWTPAMASYFNFDTPVEQQFCQITSNGLAAGQTIDDASYRACLELIERDALMLTWYAQLPCQRLTLSEVNHGFTKAIIEQIENQGMSIELYLLDAGIKVPTVVCIAFGNGITHPAVSMSICCHGDIIRAMEKAILEQGQVLPILTDIFSQGHHTPTTYDQVQSIEDHAAYYFKKDQLDAFDFMRQSEAQAISPTQWPHPTITNIAELKPLLNQAEVDIAIVNVTAKDIYPSPFRVVRALGINMQPIYFGEQYRRANCPRLDERLKGKTANPNPHPLA